jgi:beta-lactamase class D
MHNYKLIISAYLILFTVSVSFSQNAKSLRSGIVKELIVVNPGLSNYFNSCNVTGCILVFDNQKKQWITNDTVLMKSEKLPASTFKIINLLIALETGVIKDENELFKWNGEKDTVKYGFRPDTYRDMTVKEAFEISTVWVFIEMARRIGRERYLNYLNACNYGNQNLSEPGNDFWNFGELGISPLDQVNFIRDLYEGNLPFSERNMEIVKRVMITEKADNYVIRAKTGWTREGGINTGWWVGMVETKQGVWYFATLLLQDRKFNSPTFGPCRKEITKSVFKDLDVIED